MRKKVDDRIRVLIENGVKMRHRSMFIVVGDKYRDQVVNLYYMLSKSMTKSRPTVLWCYKDRLDISSHKKKRHKQLKINLIRGTMDPEKADAFSLFLESVRITYCLYKDSERILGNTFGMCILQDFEALTPNLLARTIETVEGGGLVILLLRSLASLTSLCTMVMDVHERFRKESHLIVQSRFNERFLLSLASCKACIVMDDELNILPISSHMRSITPVTDNEDLGKFSEQEQNLKNLKEQFHDDFLVSPLIGKCCTLDQGKAVITFMDAILDKNLRSTVALIAARGRGKSAALGLAVAGAIATGYSNIFITAPSPENLKTLFEFICIGFTSLNYKEHFDYDLVNSTDPDLKKVTVRINIYKQHRQTIQYIQPHEHAKLSQVELLVIDEAAAIPLPIVRSLLGPYLVFLSSTVNGYEGTGRSLSLKLLQQLEEQNQIPMRNMDNMGAQFRKVELHESIRYACNDPLESWLNGLLCLDATNSVPKIIGLPHPSECDLYYVNRDTLFSFHKDSETFLQRMMALYVASHYKNSPNDLQLMADAPAHHLFVLLGPVDETKNRLPDILCVLQICLEGQISQESVLKSLEAGHQPHGDQIPWKFSEQFQDIVFPTLSGVRIVRIAVHPSALHLGYGSAAIDLLTRYFEGQLSHVSEVEYNCIENEQPELKVSEAAEKVSLLEENIKPRANLPPLLVPLRERQPEKIQYLGVSYGLTLELFRFWRKQHFAPFYVGQNPNAVTGEYTCMMLKPFDNDEIEADGSGEWGFFGPFYLDFRQRFSRLLASSFRSLSFELAMSVLDPKTKFEDTASSIVSPNEIMSPYDMKRLEAYTNNLVDYHVILDIVPILAQKYFQECIPVSLSEVQASVLMCMGLQNQDLSYVEAQMKKLDRRTILFSFMKIMRRFYKYLNGLACNAMDAVLPRLKNMNLIPHNVSVDELEDAAGKVKENINAGTTGVLDPEKLQRYAILDRETAFAEALHNGVGRLSSSGIVSVKSRFGEKSGGHTTKRGDMKRTKDFNFRNLHKRTKSSGS